MKQFLLAALLATGCASAPATTAPLETEGPMAADHGTPSSPAVTVEPDTPLERSVFYFPSKERYADLPSGVENLTLTTPDGLKLQAWYLPPPEDRPLVLYFHGNGGNLTGAGELFETLRQLELGVLAVDYRGYGQSQGEPSEQGLYLDALTTYEEAVRRGFKPEQIILYGHSLGGGVATYLAQERPCARLILTATFTSTTDVARHRKGEAAARQIDGYDNLARIKHLRNPVFIMHGDKDETIPFEMGQKLHEACPDSTFWRVEGAGHNDLRDHPEFGRRLKSFVDG